MLVDTHLHLADSAFDPDREAVIERARAAGVSILVEIAESPAAWGPAVALAEKHPFIFASLGIHPHHAHEADEAGWPALRGRLRELLGHPKVVAVGECGLDYHRLRNTREQQASLFRRQLELAREAGKPVVVHCRNDESAAPPAGATAHRDTQAILNDFFPGHFSRFELDRPNGVIHCFSGDWADAQAYMARGFLLGVDAPVTYPASGLLRQNVLRMPLQRMVLETDAPYLPPQTHRGRRNEPSHIPAIAEAVAGAKRRTVAEVAEQTSRNARALYRLPAP